MTKVRVKFILNDRKQLLSNKVTRVRGKNGRKRKLNKVTEECLSTEDQLMLVTREYEAYRQKIRAEKKLIVCVVPSLIYAAATLAVGVCSLGYVQDSLGKKGKWSQGIFLDKVALDNYMYWGKVCNLQSSNQDLKIKIDSLKTINKEASETAHATEQQIKKLQSQLARRQSQRGVQFAKQQPRS